MYQGQKTASGYKTLSGYKLKPNFKTYSVTDLRDRLDTKLKEQITPEDVEKQIEALLDIYQEILQNAYEYCKRNPWFKEGNARKDAMKPIGRRMNQRHFARTAAKVSAGTDIASRNVAVSILARALGLRDMVAESQMIRLKVNGKEILGTAMEEVKFFL